MKQHYSLDATIKAYTIHQYGKCKNIMAVFPTALYNLCSSYMILQYLLCEQSIPLYCRWQTHFPFSQVPWPLQLFGQLDPFLFLPITALIVRELESSLNTPICQSPLDKSLTTVTISLLLRETALSYRG